MSTPLPQDIPVKGEQPEEIDIEELRRRILNPADESPQKVLTFKQMLDELVNEGSFATRLGWGNRREVVYLDGHLRIKLYKNNYQPADWLINAGDITAIDWVIVL